MWNRAAALAALLLLSCRQQPQQPEFPAAQRDVAPIVGESFSTEDARDRLGEAEEVMQRAGVRPGMWVADVGAGEGYYTVRLARVVGTKGRVLAEDIQPEVTDQLTERVQRERLDNVAVRLGTPDGIAALGGEPGPSCVFHFGQPDVRAAGHHRCTGRVSAIRRIARHPLHRTGA